MPAKNAPLSQILDYVRTRIAAERKEIAAFSELLAREPLAALRSSRGGEAVWHAAVLDLLSRIDAEFSPLPDGSEEAGTAVSQLRNRAENEVRNGARFSVSSRADAADRAVLASWALVLEIVDGE